MSKTISTTGGMLFWLLAYLSSLTDPDAGFFLLVEVLNSFENTAGDILKTLFYIN